MHGVQDSPCPSDLSGQIADPLNSYLIYGILESILTLLPVMIVLLFCKTDPGQNPEGTHTIYSKNGKKICGSFHGF